MINLDLMKKLSELPEDIPVIFKVSQEITGYDDFAWVRGECVGVSVHDLYHGDDDEIWDRERMFEDVYDYPEKYGLNKDAGDAEIDNYIDKNKKETVIAIEVHP